MSLLSICIPTYNRINELRELLNSIQSQGVKKELLEIIISDNCSTDGTENMILNFNEKLNIVYLRKESNDGPDLNYMSAVDCATSKYCWLYGSDDLMSEFSLDRMLNILSDDSFDSDIVLLDREVFDNKNNKSIQRWLNFDSNKKVIFSCQSQLISYFNSCMSLGGVFSYLSSIVVKKSSWDKYPLDECFIGTGYSHAYRLLSILNGGGILEYNQDIVPLCRADNDYFLLRGAKNRFLIDINGYNLLAEKIFENELVKVSLKKILTRERKFRSIVGFLSLCSEDERLEYSRLLKVTGFNKSKLYFGNIIIGSGLHSLLKKTKRILNW